MTLEEKKAINKSYVAFLKSLGSDLVKEIFSAAVEKQLSRAFTEELTRDLVEEIMTKGKFFQAASKTLTKTFGVVLSLATGTLNASDEHKARMEKYNEDGIPEDIAKHDAFIDAFATLVHDNLSAYFKGVDDWVFEFMLGVAGGKTDKNYIEVIADRFKTLNYKNSGTSGDDSQETFIVSVENKSYIYGDNGNDSIQNVASNATIWGGHDDDTIWSVNHESETPTRNSIFGGPGDDFIAVQDTQSTIYGGKGNDFLLTQGTKNIIYGDAGNDSVVIDSSATGNSIYGGLGDDLIFIESGAKQNKFFYTSGDGNDTIYNFGASDSLTVSGKFSTVKSGSDIKVKVGNGSILLVGAVDKKIYINGNILNDEPISSGTFTPIPYPTLPSAPESPLISGTSGDDEIENYRSNVLINAGAGDDWIKNYGSNSTIDGGAGDDYIYNRLFHGHYLSIDGGLGNDTIINEGDNTTITGGAGNDSIYNRGYYATINGGDGYNSIYNKGRYISINGGAKNDTIQNNGDYATVDAGQGNDSIYNHYGHFSTIDGGDGDDYIYNDYSHHSSIDAGNGDDFIDVWFGLDVTIDSGAGDDTISLSSAASLNVIEYTSGDGNDIISGFNSDDTLQIGGGTGTYFPKRSGDDLIVTVGKGKITLQGAANLSTLNIDGVWKDPTLLTVTNSTKSPVKVSSAIKTVDSSARTKAVQITGNKQSNTIIGGSKNDSINGAAGNDKIFGNAGNDTLNGGASNDILDGGAGNDSLSGGAAHDKIYGGKGNDTILGGTGNDSLWGDAGADKFFYAKGDGKDIIFGFDNKDTLTLDNLDFTSSYKNEILTLKVVDGSITLKNFSATTFHINNASYKISGSKLVKK